MELTIVTKCGTAPSILVSSAIWEPITGKQASVARPRVSFSRRPRSAVLAVGVCDVAEYCTGTSASCPANTYKASTTVCRAAAGVCDVPSRARGRAPLPGQHLQGQYHCVSASAGSVTWPSRAQGRAPSAGQHFKASTTVCRAAAGVCDVAESCTGTSASCPPTRTRPALPCAVQPPGL